MLKRQRASSPPPPSPSIPQAIDIRELKRRRVAPPSLDGQTRGWAHPSDPDSGEEDIHDEEIFGDEPQGVGINAKFVQLTQDKRNEEYAAVNSVLKEIHILHKHRQIFSPQALTPADTSREYHTQSLLDKNRLIYQSEGRTDDESVRVYEHYEESNRSLASAFLSRRQHSPSHDQP